MSSLPVIFIPGFTGSFNLPVLLDWRGPTLNGWSFPPFVDYGKYLLQAFTQAGYRRNRDLFVAFYDWRKPVEESARRYLVGWIDRAKKAANASKVILIGHSMGGLVARSYIQSPEYLSRNDVARLITLGTPHRGSAEAYTAWAGAEPHTDETLRTVFAVYLWYLRHIHPIQTELDKVKTIQTQVPGARDLLPIEDYLLSGNPPQLKPIASMNNRNLWGEMINQSATVTTLTQRVAVTTITGVGFNTLSAILVGPPPADHPLRYSDGIPLNRIYDAQGDGTVLQRMATVAHANNLPPLAISHGALPDSPQTLELIFGELGISPAVLGAAPAVAPSSPTPRLLIMTASPVTVEVETPSGPPIAPVGVLGAGTGRAPRRRQRRMKGHNYGHAGKALNLIVIDNPTAGDYRMVVHGTDYGHFTVGTMLIGMGEPPVLGGVGASAATEPTITTIEGDIARESDLFYTVTLRSATEAPQINFDARATMMNAIERLGAAMRDQGGILGAAPVADERLSGALSGDPTMIDAMMAAPPDQRRQMINSLIELCQTIAGDERERALAIITALKQVRTGG
ncbi:esterase/lipase family protein [Chloroflexus sp.]|uniref:esterase/lipase family protein n=1 Tax=Chloroflexus sp. TaxID=1904827 RepID=UPI0026161A15|nr:alpha/beta fold hydrolase [uncultured Chloroflexus sp.]